MKTSLLGICLVCLLLVAAPAKAGLEPYSKTKIQTIKSEYSSTKKSKRKTISSGQAASIVKSQYGGKILKVQSTSSGYRVKVLKNDGRISSVFVDGKTGRIKG